MDFPADFDEFQTKISKLVKKFRIEIDSQSWASVFRAILQIHASATGKGRKVDPAWKLPLPFAEAWICNIALKPDAQLWESIWIRNFWLFLINSFLKFIRIRWKVHFGGLETSETQWNPKCADLNNCAHLWLHQSRILDYPLSEYIQLVICESPGEAGKRYLGKCVIS